MFRWKVTATVAAIYYFIHFSHCNKKLVVRLPKFYGTLFFVSQTDFAGKSTFGMYTPRPVGSGGGGN